MEEKDILRKILPLNIQWLIISGKINYYTIKNIKLSNPSSYVVPDSKEKYVNKVIPKYSLNRRINRKNI